MSSEVFISIVIPTFNRSSYLLKILERLKINLLSFKNFEIIICDSYSKDNTLVKINNFKNNNLFLPIRYLNIKKNIHSLKRNIGIKSARGKYIIFLDDDCFPEKFFVKNFYNLLTRNSNNIYCGTVKYPQEQLKKNFVKYRQSRHFIKKKTFISKNDFLPASQIVTMNMSFKKNIFIKNNFFFNENFNRYGFEDYELAYRLVNNKFKIVKSNPVIYHIDKRSFSIYLEKIKFLGFEGMNYLIKLNLLAAKNNNFYKLENFFFIKFLLNFKIFKNFLIFSKKICILLDKQYFYFPFIYKIAISFAYLEGCFYRMRYNKNDYKYIYWYK